MTRDEVLARVAAKDPRYRKLADRPLPSLAAQALTFTRSAVRHVACGMPKASPEEQARRLEVCMGCDRHRGDGRCSECGCWTKRKAAWKGESCPIGKW